MTVSIAVVHYYPRFSVDALAHAHSFNGFLSLVDVCTALGPLASVGCAVGCGEGFRCGLEYSAAILALVEQMIELVGRVIHNVAVNGRCTVVEQEARLADKVGEVIVDV